MQKGFPNKNILTVFLRVDFLKLTSFFKYFFNSPCYKGKIIKWMCENKSTKRFFVCWENMNLMEINNKWSEECIECENSIMPYWKTFRTLVNVSIGWKWMRQMFECMIMCFSLKDSPDTGESINFMEKYIKCVDWGKLVPSWRKYGMYNGMYGSRHIRRKVCALMKWDQLFGRYGHFLTSKERPFGCRESIDPWGNGTRESMCFREMILLLWMQVIVLASM